MIDGYEVGELEAAAAASELEQSIIWHPSLVAGLKRLRLHQARSLPLFHDKPRPSHLLIVTGDPGAGKSTLLEQHKAAFDDQESADGVIMPVVLVEMPAPCTRKGLAESILNAMGHEPSSDWNTNRIVGEIANFARRHGVLMIAIDEADRIFGSEAPIVAKFLVSLLNTLDCQLTLAGAPEILQLNRGWGLERRKEADLFLSPYRFDTKEGQTNFRALLRVFDEKMGLERTCGLSSFTFSRRMFLATGGHIGLVSKLLVAALERAHLEQRAELTSELLGEIYDGFKRSKLDEKPIGINVDVEELPGQEVCLREENPFHCDEKRVEALWKKSDCPGALSSGSGDASRKTGYQGTGKSS